MINLSIQITQPIELIELLDSRVNSAESEMKAIMLSLEFVIMTIPGMVYINGGMILGEIGKITHFSRPCQQLAFAGLDLVVYQSRNLNTGKTRMTKRGSKTLRYALVNAVHNVVKNNQTFKTIYTKKMVEGRSHYNAVGNCAGKLVRTIYKMLTDNVSFNLD